MTTRAHDLAGAHQTGIFDAGFYCNVVFGIG
jgi:hypothetical protein